MNNEEQQELCEHCEGMGETPDFEWDENSNGWIMVGTRPCVCLIQRKEEMHMTNKEPQNSYRVVDAETLYPLKTILDLNVLTATSRDSNWQILQRHIRENKLRAVNVGSELRPRYIVYGRDLIDYLKNRYEGEVKIDI